MILYKNTKKAVTESSIFLGNINQLNQSENTNEFIIDSENSGWVKYLFYFNQIVEETLIVSLNNKDIFKPPIGKAIKMTTKDQRICRSDCTTKPTPGNAGSPQAPVEAVAKSIEANDKIGIDSQKSSTDKNTS